MKNNEDKLANKVAHSHVFTSFLAVNLCEEKPCKHGGKCIPVGLSYRCECMTGYEGIHCQKCKSFMLLVLCLK